MALTDKIDFKKTVNSYQARNGEIEVIDVPDLQYLMINGQGDPNTSPAFAEAVAALYPVAYKIKFASKINLGRDYVVPPLEGLWWAEDMNLFTAARDKSRWNWTLLLMVPDWISPEEFLAAKQQVGTKNPPARLDEVRLETLSEGRCVQTLHVGSFDEEAEVLERIHHEFIPRQGLGLAGRHHEIYLTDFRRVPPARQRTILRQPVTGPRIVDLAEHLQLVPGVAELRWREWGDDVQDLHHWVEVTGREAGRHQLPCTLVALGPDGEIWGAVALGRADDGLTDSERAGRGPWLLGLVVDPAHRRGGVGRLLVSEIEQAAARRGHKQLWVATGPPADAFYRRCGWVDAEVLRLSSDGELATILLEHLLES